MAKYSKGSMKQYKRAKLRKIVKNKKRQEVYDQGAV